MTVFQDRLFARMGSPVTGQPQRRHDGPRPGYLVCLDLAAEGRLLWKIEPEEGWAFEGSPVADARGVYVAMRRRTSGRRRTWPVSTPRPAGCAGGGSSAAPRRPPAASSTKAPTTC